MGGKSGQKVPIPRYNMSLHMGFCHGPVDTIKEIWVGEKKAWEGRVSSNSTISINNENLFGGIKKEGGVKGVVEFMFGAADQLVSSIFASKLDRPGPSSTPGFRGITSLLFRGSGSPAGFYWTASNPYLKEIWLRVARCPRTLDPGTAVIYSEPPVGISRTSYHTDVPVWSGNPIRITAYSDFGYIVALLSTHAAWTFNADSSLRGTAPSIPTDPAAPSGFTYIDTMSGKNIFVRVTGTTISSSSCLQASTGSVLTPYQDITGSLPGDEKMIGVATCKETGNLLVITRIGPVSVSSSGPARWYLINASGSLQAQGDVNGSVSQYSFGFGNRAFSVYSSACSLSPDLVNMWTASGSGTQSVEVWTRIDGVLTRTGQIPGAMTPGGSFSVPSIIATRDGAFVATSSNYIGAYQMTATFALGRSGRENANPAHVVYECLTNTDWGMGASTDAIDTDAFILAAQTLYAENFGVFMQWVSSSPIEDFINDVLDHIKGALFTNPRTGKITLRLLRDDYDIGDLPNITPDKAALTNFARRGWGETSNEIVVTWTNPENEQEETVYSQDLGNIAIQGNLVSDSRNYYGVRSGALAQQLADRELRSASASLCSCEAKVDRSLWDITPYECVLLDWPEYGINGLVMRVMQVDYGSTGDSSIKLSLVEDVFALPFAAFVPPAESEVVTPVTDPYPVNTARIMPMPAYAVSQISGDLDSIAYPQTRATLLAANPTQQSDAQYDFLIQEVSPSGAVLWTPAGNSQAFDGKGTLTAALAAEARSLSMPPLTDLPVSEDTFLFIGPDAAAADEMEVALVNYVDPITGGMSILRGVLDTIPVAWPAGTSVWACRADQIDEIPQDLTDGQTASVRVTTITQSGMTPDSFVPTVSGTVFARPSLPLRPANVKINGMAFPASGIQIDGNVTLTWAHRNRFLEDSAVYAWDDPSVTPETGVTYTAQMVRTDTGAVVASSTGVTGTTTTLSASYAGEVRVDLWAVRDSEISWQTWSLTYIRGVESLTTESGEGLLTEDNEQMITEVP